MELTEIDHSHHGHAVNNAVTSHPSAHSCRHLVFVVTLALLLFLAGPYLLFGSTHPDSCYIVRSPRHIKLEAARAESEVKAELGELTPNVEAVESSPASGRKRHPQWYFANQTVIMLVLLVTCLGLKVAYAWLYMRPTVAESTTKMVRSGSDMELGSEHRRGASTSLGVPGMDKTPLSVGSNTRRLTGVKGPGGKVTPNRTPEPQSRSLHSTATATAPAAPVFRFHWYEMFRILYAYEFYLAAYFLCQALKSLIGDTSCSTHGNSVSGHYLFFVYAVLMVAYFHLSQKRLEHESLLSRTFWYRLLHDRLHPIDYAFLVVYPIFLLVCLSILVDTYIFGFHSLRQIIYGFALAVVVFLGVTGVFEAVEERLKRQKGYAQAKGGELSTEDGSHGHLANPSLSVAVIPFVSGLLYEWMYSDEMQSRFYVFPLASVVAFQISSWLLLAVAPHAAYHWTDVAAVVVGWAILGWIWFNKLKAPSVGTTPNATRRHLTVKE